MSISYTLRLDERSKSETGEWRKELGIGLIRFRPTFFGSASESGDLHLDREPPASLNLSPRTVGRFTRLIQPALLFLKLPYDICNFLRLHALHLSADCTVRNP
jgi:hypothetical protein